MNTDQMLQQAITHHKAGELENAEKRYRSILKEEPKHPDANHNLGVLLKQGNKADIALPFFKTALESNPNQGQYWISYIDSLIYLQRYEAAQNVLNQGQAKGLKGDAVDQLRERLNSKEKPTPEPVGTQTKLANTDLEPAIQLRESGNYQKAYAWLEDWNLKHPNDPEGIAHLAHLLLLLKKDDLAFKKLNQALPMAPDAALVQRNLARIYLKQKKPNDALTAATKAFDVDSHNHENCLVLASALAASGEKVKALELVESIIKTNNDYAEAYATRALLRLQNQDLKKALIDCEKALSIKPHLVQLWALSANLYHQEKNLLKAIVALEQALVIEPDNIDYMTDIGEFYRQAEKFEQSLSILSKAVELAPERENAWINYGTVLQQLERLPEAKVAYNHALKINPNKPELLNNLGAVAKSVGNWEESVKYLTEAIQLNPDSAEAHSNLGVALKELGQLEAAVKHYERALAIKPDYAEAHQGYSVILGYMSNYDDVITHSDIAIDLKDDPEFWKRRLYVLIYHPDLSAETICAEHIRWGERFPETTKNIFSKHDRTFNRRLRIGYVSPDFRGHSCRFYFEPLFSQHDHARVELFAYSNVGLEDEHTQRFKTYFETWRNIRHISDQEASEMIRNDKIDILIDGCGHMQGSRLELFALKPAPIQVTWLGAAWTTGLKQMDYVLFDPYMAPPEIKTSEVVVQLPRTWAAYRPSEKATNTTVTVLPALQNGYITFGYSGRSERLNYKVFHTWGKLLKQLPKAQLVIDYKCFSDPSTQAYYQNFMTEQGMDISRVTLRHSTNIFTALGGIDILLDSFPHSGGTMLFDALWMGVPTITLASRPPVGRIGTSLMINLNLADWVAYTEESYIAKAVEFAADIKELAKLRSDMRERMRKSPVMDEKGFAHDVENAYRKMWRDWSTKTDT